MLTVEEMITVGLVDGLEDMPPQAGCNSDADVFAGVVRPRAPRLRAA